MKLYARFTGLLPAAAFAGNAVAQSAAPAASAPPAGPSMLPMITALVFVLALIPLAMWLLKRFGGAHGAGSSGLRVVAQLALGPRERIVVVEAGERWLLLGVTAASITRVGTLAKGELPAAPPAAANFAALLSAARGRTDGK
jgi:flagellar protein FliO/FliZ